MSSKFSKNKSAVVSEPTGDSSVLIGMQMPYKVEVEITGVTDILFHRYSVEDEEIKQKSPKGSSVRKTDNIESYVYRNDKGDICVPGEYLRQAIIRAAKFKKDPRSPRASARDLYEAGVVCNTKLASLGRHTWDFLDRRRAIVNGGAITRTRPAFLAGWKVEFEFEVLLPEHIAPNDFYEVLIAAGRFIGIGDFIPTYGRFSVTKFKLKD